MEGQHNDEKAETQAPHPNSQPIEGVVKSAHLPSALDHVRDMQETMKGTKAVFFLDYDGTLTPITEDPQDARLSKEMATTLQRLASQATVAIVSGRDLAVIKARVGIPDNEILKSRVASALRVDPYLERYNVTVNAQTGWVYLSGNVDTSFKKNRAERVTERVEGVVGVVNNLEYDYHWVWTRDTDIRENVRDQLRWNPFVDASDITMTVNDGKGILHGTVDSWTEREEAEKNAYQGGAKDVTNNIVVDHRYYGPYGIGYYGSPHFRGPAYYGPHYEPYE